MSRILVVSNRLPITVKKTDHDVQIDQSSGGLATGLQSIHKSDQVMWLGWPGISLEKARCVKKELDDELKNRDVYPIYLKEGDVKSFYNGFCNSTIWPLFHYFPLESEFRSDWWKRYIRVNQLFANEIIKISKETDLIWVHDFHLMLLPMLLRNELPKAKVGFFLHIPFPTYEVFRLLPWRKQVLDGILGADLVAFHTYQYMAHFLESISLLCGHESIFGQINVGDRIVRVDALPMGIDYDRFSKTSESSNVLKIASRYKKNLKERRVILSVDRLDYTKGIIQRLEAYRFFLNKHPSYKGKIVFILLVVPSRAKVEQYTKLKKQIDEVIGEINGKLGTLDWSPIQYMYRSVPFDSLVALYKIADIALITPRRDGMNLVAKEFIASKTDSKGVLILSETAGAAMELGEAIIVNPNSKEEISQAIEDALNMPEEEQTVHNIVMQQRLSQNTVSKWANDFLEKLKEIKAEQKRMQHKMLNTQHKKELFSKYSTSTRRLLMLDYDGTLTSFRDTPDMAKPDSEIIDILIELAQDHRNDVVLISGRDRGSLEDWFGGLNINLVAEHGAWTCNKDSNWQQVRHIPSDWKPQILSILEAWVSRIPGSFVEMKDYSIAWHYRKVDPRISKLRRRDVINELVGITANLGLQILKGNKVIEVRNKHINKGVVAETWRRKNKYDFILAIGDDYTDEDMFNALPSNAWTIRVGLAATNANYNIKSPTEVKTLLKELIKSLPDE